MLFVKLRLLNMSVERVLYVSGFQAEGALTLKTLADNESAVRGLNSTSRSGVSVAGCVIGIDEARLRQRDAYWPASLSVSPAAVGT